MYPITNEVKALFEAEQRKVLRITGTDKNGTSITITDDNVIADSFQIDRYSCNGEKLEVGTAIAAQLSFTLENGSSLYNSIVFEGAELFVEVGIADWMQSSPTITYVPCGYFTSDSQLRRLSTISITALDRMTKFDVVVDGTGLTFPTTVAGLVGQVNTLCGVTLAESISGLPNASVSIAALPSVNGEITYRNLIQWCAGIMGTNAWFDWNGQLRFSWYANTTGYVSTTDNRYNSDMYEDDLTVSGVEYTNDSGIVIVEGTDDYAIDLTGNAIAGTLVATVLPALNTALNGFTYRPFTAATINAPYLWPMDVMTFTDMDGNNHTSVLTNVAFGLNGTTAMESKGMTYAVNKLAQPKGFTREQAQLVSQAMAQVEDDIDESLTQQEIFDRLTDNGDIQGLFMRDGQIYFNATYIKAGMISDGSGSGANSWNLSTGELTTKTGTIGKFTLANGVLSYTDESATLKPSMSLSSLELNVSAIDPYIQTVRRRLRISNGAINFYSNDTLKGQLLYNAQNGGALELRFNGATVLYMHAGFGNSFSGRADHAYTADDLSGPIVKYVNYTAAYQIAASGQVNLTGDDFGVSTPSGYTPLTLRNYSTGNRQVVAIQTNAAQTGSGIIMRLQNMSNSAITDLTASIGIVYIKSGYIE